MSKRISLRWKLILLSWFLALGTSLLLTTLLHQRSEHQLLEQLEKTLTSKCDEVISVLESTELHTVLEEFLDIETRYRWSPHIYFYQISNIQGDILAQSQNLAGAALPIPEGWETWDAGTAGILLRTESDPVTAAGRIRLRSERVTLELAGRESTTLLIQTAASLEPLNAAVSKTLREALLGDAVGLGAIFFLLWYVTTRALRPVELMTRKASEITATNLNERLPVTGNGDELDRLAEVLNDMISRLGESLRQIEQFSSGAAHQLRTPLTRMRGELDLLLRNGASAPLKDQLEKVREELEGLSRLCSQLLLLSRLHDQASATTVFKEQVALEEIVAELFEQMAPLAEQRGVRLRRGQSSAVRVRGSRALLVQALFNLLSNAIDYTDGEGTVTVSIEVNADEIRLAVEDQGPGIPLESRDNVFQPFYRVPRPPGRTRHDGTGMGLAIVRGIARAHGGRVEFREAPAGGSIFSLVLPRSSLQGRTTSVGVQPVDDGNSERSFG